MSQINELIEKLCPNGVEWKTLESVSKIITPPKKIQTIGYKTSGKYLIIDQGQDYIAGYTDDKDALLPLDEYVLYGDHTCVVKYANKEFAQGADGLKILKPNNCVCKYLYYAICLYNIKSNEYKRHWTQVKSIQIPIPPLEIQNRIVEILDHFTNVTANLTAELNLRRKQFEHYREKLLSLDGVEGVEWKTLGEVCNVITKGTTPKSFTKDGIAFIKTEAFTKSGIDIEKLSYVDEETHNGFLKRSILKENDILFTIAGATIGKCIVVDKSLLPANTNQALAIIRLNQSVLCRYVFYLLKSKLMASYIEKKCKTSGQPNLTLELIRDFSIPVPPLKIQQSIVEKLDKFNALIENIEKELDLRQKQYEYYREELLNFN